MNDTTLRWGVRPVVINEGDRKVITISYHNEHHVKGEGIAQAIILIEADKRYLQGTKEAVGKLTGFSKIVEETETALKVMLTVESHLSRYQVLQGIKFSLIPWINKMSDQLRTNKPRWRRDRPYDRL